MDSMFKNYANLMGNSNNSFMGSINPSTPNSNYNFLNVGNYTAAKPAGLSQYFNRDFMLGKQGQMGFLPFLGGLGSGLGNLYTGQKQYGLMEDALDWNKNIGQTNLDNQTKLVNNQIYDQMWSKLNSTGKYGNTPEEQARLEADVQAAISGRVI
jgi:hypothetical protein